VAYGIWQGWWYSSLWLLVALTASIRDADAADGRPKTQQVD
jgi:hypothetical protein